MGESIAVGASDIFPNGTQELERLPRSELLSISRFSTNIAGGSFSGFEIKGMDVISASIWPDNERTISISQATSVGRSI